MSGSSKGDPIPRAIRDTYGEVGMLDMPSGHMAADGELAASASNIGGPIQRYSVSFQFFPWLDTSFRYSHVTPNSQDWDRSFAAKVRLIRESDGLADVSVGIRDVLGTGLYSSEYIAVSKSLGQFDLTAGLGWGRLATAGVVSNPLGVIGSLKNRSSSVTTGGVVNFGQFFRGAHSGVFGGAVWQTPVTGLKLLAEYSSDHYDLEAGRGGLHVRSPVNVGLSYSPFEALSFSAGWFYGATYGVTVTLRGDPTSSFPSGLRIGPAVPPPAVRSDSEQTEALGALRKERLQVIMAKRAGPWLRVPTPTERVRQDLLEAYLSGARGVRDVEIRGKSLMVDAHVETDDATQCASYARIASASSTSLTTIALSDLQDAAGMVTFCPIRVANKTTSVVAVPLSQGDDDQLFYGDELRRKISADLDGQSLQLSAMWSTRSELWLYYENYRYRQESRALGRIVRVLMADAPPSVEVFHIMPVQLGVPQKEVVIARSAVERSIIANLSSIGLEEGITVKGAPLDNPVFNQQASARYPLFSWSIDPKLTEHVFDPDAPLQFMIYGDAAALLQIAPGLALSAELTGTIWTNYNFTREAGSVLPHVRTDLLQYLKHGKYGISQLSLIYRSRLTPTVFSELRAGYLEDMFSGVGGQVLWRPQDSRVAFGADLYQVWKRDFNRLFGTQHYNVATGHVSVYFDSPWYGLNFAVHGGRYLAGDWGGTLQVTRRFDSGVEIGAWATFTNVPFSRFGEGSFDKGIIIHIPLDWALPIQSQSAYDLHMSSLTRDGGQRLVGDDSLYDVTRGSSYGELAGHLENVAAP